MKRNLYNPKVLCISAGLSSKKNPLLEELKTQYDAKVIPGKKYKEKFLDRFIKKIIFLRRFSKYYINISYLNKTIIEYKENFDLLFIVKGNFVKYETIKFLKENNKNLVVVGWSPDDIFLKHNNSKILKKSAPYYDFFFTSKKINVEKGQLKEMGFRNPIFKPQGYSSKFHYPIIKKNSFFKDKVIFIGYGEKERFDYLSYLAKNGIEIHIWGNGWRKFSINKNKNLKIYNKTLIGEIYSEALSNAFTSLCFLRKLNNDQHTSRTFEIPACKGFMIAERSIEHLKFFKENQEAIYFSSKSELLEKIRYFQINKLERNKIVNAGYKKAINSNYSYDIIAKEIITESTKLGHG